MEAGSKIHRKSSARSVNINKQFLYEIKRILEHDVTSHHDVSIFSSQ